MIKIDEVVRGMNHANLRKRMSNVEMFLLSSSENISEEMKQLIDSVIQTRMARMERT